MITLKTPRVRFLLLTYYFLFAFMVNSQEAFKYNPQKYICYKTNTSIKIDGDLSEESWQNALWTSDFVDIEGSRMPEPAHLTRAKMLWDEEYFYIAAELLETDIWATYDQKDMIIFHENDFEVFIDPDGDTHNYYELEINAMGTIWDLMLTKPYRDGGKAIDSWEIPGLKSAVKIKGTINDPSDEDDRWFVELAFPWQVLEEAAQKGGEPVNGEQWRVNFSRVNWQIIGVDGKYVKETEPYTGNYYPEFNWVWSPQGEIAMHQPETWGFVQFSEIVAGKGTDTFKVDKDNEIKWLLRSVYFAQIYHKTAFGEYSKKLSLLEFDDQKIKEKVLSKIRLDNGILSYQAYFTGDNYYIIIDQEGKIITKPINR